MDTIKLLIFKLSVICFILFSILFFNACKKEETTKRQETDSIIIEGKVYKTVKIGSQWWTTENLNVKTYRNGDSIKYIGKNGTYDPIRDSTQWNNINSGAYCNGQYGYLYNGYAITNSHNIAPVGWHIPSDDEWKQLEKYLGMSQTEADKVNWRGTKEGDKLKASNTIKFWPSPSPYEIWPNNESGFTALPGRCIMFYGMNSDDNDKYIGFWWSSTLQGNQMWYRYLSNSKSGIFRYYGSMTYGFSIRCVKD